jgi:hypothetical protein
MRGGVLVCRLWYYGETAVCTVSTDQSSHRFAFRVLLCARPWMVCSGYGLQCAPQDIIRAEMDSHSRRLPFLLSPHY